MTEQQPSTNNGWVPLVTPSVVVLILFTNTTAYAQPTKPKGAQPVSLGASATQCIPSVAPPVFVYEKGPGKATHDGRMTLWASVHGCQVSISARAGSGLLHVTDTCKTGRGALPNGSYKIRRFFEKRGGSSVVRGAVWHLSDQRCPNGKVVRSALFIHTNGIEGTAWNDRYTTNGCIKLSQVDRDRFADLYHRAVGQDQARLIVTDHVLNGQVN